MHVIGEVDLATAPQFRRELIAAAADSTALALDLTDCDLIDSIGLGVTLGGARRVAEAGGEFVVVAGAAVLRTFERCRLDDILRIVPDVSLLEAAAPS